jgi:ankyrin repeat protein
MTGGISSKSRIMKIIFTLCVVVFLSGCYPSSNNLRGGDIRLWKDTPAWKLAKAVQRNDTNQINRILSTQNLSIDYREPKYGESLLYWAVWNNDIKMVHFLLSKRADPNLHIFYNGESPISLSCKYLDMDIMNLKLLLQYKVNHNDCVLTSDSVTYEYSTRTPLYNAASTDLEKVKLLVKSGANIDMAIEAGDTPLKVAALMNKFGIAKYLLLECGADPQKAFMVTMKGDTLRFMDILGSDPYQHTEENERDLRQIREYIKNRYDLE